MNIRGMVLSAALAAFALAAAPYATADDVEAKSGEGRVIVFGDGVARFNVVHDQSAGTLLFRLADPSVKIADAPIVVVRTDEGPKEVTLVAVEGETGVWRLEHESLRGEKFDGTMKIVVADKPYEAAIVLAAAGKTTTWVARHGGIVVALPDCAAHIEAVMDRATGTLTIYSLDENVKIAGDPQIIVTEKANPQTIVLKKVDGETFAWRIEHASFKQTTLDAKIKLMVDGKPCEAPLSFAPHGGHIITVRGGPRFEVVADETGRTYTFYAIDDTVDGKAYTIDTPPVVVWDTPEGPRTATLVPVEREPRAWRLVWADAALRRPADARLRFTLFGKTLETNFGLSGVGVGVR